MEQQYPDLNCDALNTERTRLLTESADLNAPLHSSKTEAERDSEITQVNGKLYAIAKVQSDRGCPLVANAPPSSVVRQPATQLARCPEPHCDLGCRQSSCWDPGE